MQQKSYKHGFQVKAIDGNNLHIAGYASVFNVEDGVGHIIMPGAFKDAIKEKKIKFLWQHKQEMPIGVIDEIYEDYRGLYIKATINGSIQSGGDAKSLVEQGAVDGFSIGFCIKESHFNNDGKQVITKIDLWEVSIVTFPCNTEAVIDKFAKKLSIINKQEKENIMSIETIDQARFLKVEKSLENIESAFSRPDISVDHMMIDTKFATFLRAGAIDLETKSLNTNANEEGGFMLRPELENRIVTGIKAKSPMRQLASVETISTNALDILIERNRFVSNWVADAAVRPDTDNAGVTQKRISVHELYAQPKATQRLLDDGAINIESWISERLEDSFARLENASFVSGDGANKPHGILSYGNDVINRVDVAEAGHITITDIQALINALDEYYLANASFLMHRTTLAAIQDLRDENGRFLWQASLSEKAPGTLFGIPVMCSSDMPDFQAENLGIILADFKAGYKIVDKIGIHSLRDQYTEKPFVKFYTVKRVGGDVVDSNAIKVLKV